MLTVYSFTYECPPESANCNYMDAHPSQLVPVEHDEMGWLQNMECGMENGMEYYGMEMNDLQQQANLTHMLS